MSQEMKDIVWLNVLEFLNQNDLLSLGRTNTFLNKICSEKLYGNIVIARDPVLRSNDWYLDGGVSCIGGYRSLKKSADQNDIFLYDRIMRLTESSHLPLVKRIVIQEDVFYDEDAGSTALQQLIDKLLQLDKVETLDIRHSVLFEKNYAALLELTNLRQCKVVNLGDLNKLRSLHCIKSLELFLTHPDFEPGCISSRVKDTLSQNLQELVVDDLEHSSLRLFQYLQNEGVFLGSVRSLKFNHVHGIHDYNKTMRELTTIFLKDVFDLQKLRRLEFEGSCEETKCSCFNDFLMDLVPELQNLNEVGLIEKTFVTQGNHYTEENWDLTINKFLLHLPRVGSRLKKLAIRHNPPLNGIAEDSVEGNYIRRRTLYENVLPKLKNLRTLIAPSFLRSLSAYEILVCDLLWNGCECDFCTKALGILDKYIMNHQYYSFPDGAFKDVIPTVFFAYAGDALSRRFITETDWDLKSWSTVPILHTWDLHGYEYIQHFHDFDCRFDETVYVAVAKCISHFFNTYMDHLVKYLPSLQSCILSGIYYSVDKDGHYKCVYD